MTRAESGTVLLEVLVALTLLLAGGVTVVALIGESLRSEAALGEREATMQAADRTMAALTLLRRSDLDRRLGHHPAGRFTADIRRPEPTLYRIALSESGADAPELLVTVVHRPPETAQ